MVDQIHRQVLPNNDDITKTLTDIHSVIDLYKTFNKYKNFTREQLFYYLQKPISLGQCKIFYNNNLATGFISWAYFNNKTEKHFKKTGEVLYWSGGKNIWLIDLVSAENLTDMIKYAKKHFSNIMTDEQRINYIRVDEKDRIVKYSSQINKDHYK